VQGKRGHIGIDEVIAIGTHANEVQPQGEFGVCGEHHAAVR
jgi:hypothetical protein